MFNIDWALVELAGRSCVLVMFCGAVIYHMATGGEPPDFQ